MLHLIESMHCARANDNQEKERLKMRETRTVALRLTGAISVTALALVLASNVHAGKEILGDSGWEARWSTAKNPTLDIDFMTIIGDTIFIEKSAQFIQPSVNGVYSSVVVTFRQVGDSNIQHIVMDDEVVTNSTGSAWTGFVMKLVDHGQATFDPIATAASGGGGPIGFGIDPFSTAVFSNDNTKLTLSGGVVENDDTWLPGGGENGGQLWMNVVSGGAGNYTTFSLKERPTATVVPGPSVLAGLAGFFALAGRRRRNR
jgi:MYXO-CTERM domain-containing protein